MTLKLDWKPFELGTGWHARCGRVTSSVEYDSSGGGYTAIIGNLTRSKSGVFKDYEKAQEWAENRLREIASEILNKLGGKE